MKRTAVGLVVAWCVATGCTPMVARVPFQLAAYGGLVASNSPMHVGRREPRLIDDRLEILYSVLFENVSAGRIDIALDRTKTKMSGATASCSVNGQPAPTLLLRRGDRSRVDCRLVLSPEATAATRRADSDVTLVIPIGTPAGEAEITFYYWLRVEDAS